MGNNNSSCPELGQNLIETTESFLVKFESKLNEFNSPIPRNLTNSITKDLYSLNQMIKGKLGSTKIGVMSRCEESSSLFFNSLFLSNSNEQNSSPLIYCSEKHSSNINNSSNIKYEENIFGNSFELGKNITDSHNEIFKNARITNKSPKLINFPNLPVLIKDHLMMINLPKMKKRETYYSNKKDQPIKYEIDLNEIQKLLLYFSYCDVIIYIVKETNKSEELDYLVNLIENSLILQSLKEENKLYILVNKSKSDKQGDNNIKLQQMIEKIKSSINHRFYYEIDLSTSTEDKTLFFYRYFKTNTSDLKESELAILEKEFLSIAENRYINQGKTKKNIDEKEFKEFKVKLKDQYKDPKSCISKDYREFEEVLVDQVMFHLSKNFNLIKSDLSYKMLMVLALFNNSIDYKDKINSMKEEIIKSINEVFNSIVILYEDNKQLFINDNLILSSSLNDIQIKDFVFTSLFEEVFDFTGRSHKYSYLNEKVRVIYLDFIKNLYDRFTKVCNNIQTKFSFLERKVLNCYINVFLSLERDYLNFSNDYNFLFDQIKNNPIDKTIPIKIKSTALLTNLFFSIFSKKSPEISFPFKYYLIPNILGVIVSVISLKLAINGNKATKITWGLVSVLSLALGFYFSVLANKQYNKESKKSFDKNIKGIECSVNEITDNFSNLVLKLRELERFYEFQATEMINLSF